MLLSFPSGVCETLEKMCVTVGIPDSSFERALGYMAYSRSRDVDWSWCT